MIKPPPFWTKVQNISVTLSPSLLFQFYVPLFFPHPAGNRNTKIQCESLFSACFLPNKKIGSTQISQGTPFSEDFQSRFANPKHWAISGNIFRHLSKLPTLFGVSLLLILIHVWLHMLRNPLVLPVFLNSFLQKTERAFWAPSRLPQ